MNETLALALGGSVAALMVIGLIAALIFVCAYHKGIYKSFKKPVRTMGVIGEVRVVSGESYGDESSRDYYVITYSYTDNGGVQRAKYVQVAAKRRQYGRQDSSPLRQPKPSKQHCRLSAEVREKFVVEGFDSTCRDHTARRDHRDIV